MLRDIASFELLSPSSLSATVDSDPEAVHIDKPGEHPQLVGSIWKLTRHVSFLIFFLRIAADATHIWPDTIYTLVHSGHGEWFQKPLKCTNYLFWSLNIHTNVLFMKI